MIGTYVMDAMFFGLIAFMLYAFTQYGKPMEIEFYPVTFGGRPLNPPAPARVTMVASTDSVLRIPAGTRSVTIRAAAGARVVIG